MPVLSYELPVPSSDVVFKELGDSAVLYDRSSEVYFGLNEIGIEVWRSLPPVMRTLDDLVSKLRTRFPEVPPTTLRVDTVEFLDSLVDSGLATR